MEGGNSIIHKIKIATTQEIAALLQLKEDTLRQLASRGKLPGIKLGKSWRFDVERIERLFAGVSVEKQTDQGKDL